MTNLELEEKYPGFSSSWWVTSLVLVALSSSHLEQCPVYPCVVYWLLFLLSHFPTWLIDLLLHISVSGLFLREPA